MNWDEVGAIGQVLGSIAVFVTLIYLARQIQQNTSALRSAFWQAVQDAEHRFDQSIAADPGACELFARGLAQGPQSLDSVERVRFGLQVKQLLDLAQTLHYHHETGMVDETWWRTWVPQYRAIGSAPGFVAILAERREFLRPTFRTFLEQYIVPSNAR
jgi:hypothetical protein